jgi:hypothetical protein
MRHALGLVCVAACGFSPSGSMESHDAGVDVPVAGPSCSDQVLDGDEIDVDCGGSCPACTQVFGTDDGTLARFELNGDTTDSSGHQRDATLIGGQFVATSWGMGLELPGTADQGFQWSAYANLLVHPYTIEMVVTPDDTSCYKKLFGPSDSMDNGWHYCGSFQTYPNNLVGPLLGAHQRHYFALVSTSATQIAVYINGTEVGTVDASFTAPPSEAIFFRDDTSTSRLEALAGVVEAVRISKVARTTQEITATATKLARQP